jgi:thiol-disulfide isomerase/thioredoxin
MKNIFTSFVLVFTVGFSFGQIGAVAPNFTSTDISGNSHTLYSYLNAGKLVLVDVSATWCGPCWNFHNAHYLEDLYAEFGPNGTDDIVVLFYEGDAATTLADLNGTGGNTQGDWVTGTPYPIINDSPLNLSTNIYAPLGFPTINVICPSDKKIKADLWDSQASTQAASLQNMRTLVLGYINSCTALEIEEGVELVSDITIAPNPTSASTTVTLTALKAESVSIGIFDVSGKEISIYSIELTEGANELVLEMANLEAGRYFVKISNENYVSKMIPVVKH